MVMSSQTEKSFIFDCLNAFIHEAEGSPPLRNRRVSKLCWDRTIKMGRTGRILPFLIHAMGQTGLSKRLSKKEQIQFQGLMLCAEAENRQKLKEFKAISELFARHDIPLIPLKGIAFTYLLYQKTPLRSMGDIDILIKTDDLEKAQGVLLQNGFAFSEITNRWQAKPTMKVIGRWSFKKENIDVDLQWAPKFFTQAGLSAWNEKDAWQRAEPDEALGQNVYTLSAIDQFLYLSLQILNDIEINRFYTIQLLDLALLIKTCGIRRDAVLNALASNPGLRTLVRDLYDDVNECFFKNKPYLELSSGAKKILDRFLESSSKPERGFALKKILNTVQSPWERFLFVLGYFFPRQIMPEKNSSPRVFEVFLFYVNHWKKQFSSLFKLLSRQRQS